MRIGARLPSGVLACATALVVACGGSGESDESAASGGEGPSEAGAETFRDGSSGDGGSAPGHPDGGALASEGGAPAVDAAGADAGLDAGAQVDADPADAGQVDAGPVSNDPFDPISCTGPVLTAADALARLAGAPRQVLGPGATILGRYRTCPSGKVESCGPWGAPVVHPQSFLTYSGGAVTDYKTFPLDTKLVLFATAGTAKLVVRHDTDVLHDAKADTRGIVFPFGADPMPNANPLLYVWDVAPAPNRYQDLVAQIGSSAALTARTTCARLAIAYSLTYEIAALYRF